MILLKHAFGATTQLANIRPPEGSFEDWDRFLSECQKAGMAAIDPATEAFPAHLVLGFALLKAWRSLRYAREVGMEYSDWVGEENRSLEALTAQERAMTQAVTSYTARARSDQSRKGRARRNDSPDYQNEDLRL